MSAPTGPVVSVGDLKFEVDVIDRADQRVMVLLVIEPSADLPDTWLLRIRPEPGTGTRLELDRLTLRWTVPAIDMHGIYAGPPTPEDLARLPFWRFERRTAGHTGVPFFSLFHRSGANRCAVGLLDQVGDAVLEATLSEATRAFTFEWRKPIRPAEGQAWLETVFVSRSTRPWPEVLEAYVETVDADSAEPRLPVPGAAFDPVFCTWTAIHHEVSAEWVERNARIAADLGFGTWLTDDGWFTDHGAFGDYRYAGDWRPSAEKFPDMAAHVRAVQATGLRYVLWLAPFMVGHASSAAEAHLDLLESANEELGFRNLSPRRPESAQIVEALVERLVSEFGLDGLKIDFLDAIGTTPELSPPDRGPTAGAGVHDAMTRAVTAARRSQPSLLVEVRNTYANLASRRFANLYRASDVPLNPAANRWQVAMLRLLAPDRAVHLDPALWHPGDTDENVAVHLINVISSVPTIGIELEHYPTAHLELIRHWLAFYRDHRDTIVHGAFRPEIRLGQVPVIRFDGANEQIVGLYDDVAIRLENAGTTWLLNASTRPFVELLPGADVGQRRVIRRDRFGTRIGDELIELPVARLSVEVGGSLEILVDDAVAVGDLQDEAA